MRNVSRTFWPSIQPSCFFTEKPNKKNIELINNYKEYDNNLIKTQLKKNISLQDVNVELIK